MTFTESFLHELETESNTTRKMLQRVPADKYDWKPHEKSMTIRQLATHVAEIPGWINMVLNTTELDFEKTGYNPVPIHNNTELLAYFEKSLAEGKEGLQKANDKQMEDNWTMRSGSNIYFSSSKRDMIRTCFCQVVHHRAQLGVYLRLLNIPIPGSYGPSADEPEF